MADHYSRFTRHGFLTLWALFFLAGVSLILLVVLAGQSARQQSTLELIKAYNRSTSQIERAIKGAQHPHKRAPRTVKPGDSPERLLE